MEKHNTELSNIIPFKEDGDWYLKLIYKYEDKRVSIRLLFQRPQYHLFRAVFRM